MEMIYFGNHGPSAPLTTPMKLWQTHTTVLVFDNDLLAQNFSICQST